MVVRTARDVVTPCGFGRTDIPFCFKMSVYENVVVFGRLSALSNKVWVRNASARIDRLRFDSGVARHAGLKLSAGKAGGAMAAKEGVGRADQSVVVCVLVGTLV